ncbi:YncE family protein [uncultured Jatrophihabitans sp.]|uniref:YncE family protein n=1 Tax=uncultured Jatrophihabitans sp. TaxID=1610747 RepID=UPI0035CA1AF2
MANRRMAGAAVLCTAVAMLVACGSDGSKGPGAAEPATAPPTSTAPSGTFRRIGDEPEGLVYDRTTDLVAVAVHNPDRLQLLDPATLTVRRSVSLPGSVRHLQLAKAGGPVLVPVESASKLLEVSLPAGSVKETTVVGKQPHDATAGSNGDVVVGNEFGKSISILRDGKVLKTISDLKQPGGVIGDGSTVAVVDVGAFALSTYSLTTLTRTARVPAGAGPTHGNLLNGNRVIVADTRGNAMLVYDVAPLKRIGRLALEGNPYGMAVDDSTDTVWVTLTALNQVVGLDVSGDTPRVIARYDTVRQPNTVAVDPGSHRVWVTGTDAGVVQLITR